MQRLLSLFVLIIAVIALSGPSLARGLEGVGQPVRPILLQKADGSLRPAYIHCKTRDGTPALPCHPDLGVLAVAPMPATPPAPIDRIAATASFMAARLPEAELPPPR